MELGARRTPTYTSSGRRDGRRKNTLGRATKAQCPQDKSVNDWKHANGSNLQ